MGDEKWEEALELDRSEKVAEKLASGAVIAVQIGMEGAGAAVETASELGFRPAVVAEQSVEVSGEARHGFMFREIFLYCKINLAPFVIEGYFTIHEKGGTNCDGAADAAGKGAGREPGSGDPDRGGEGGTPIL